MIFQVCRLAVTTNRIHSCKQIQRIWWQTHSRRNMHILLNKTLINGQWISAESNAEVAVINPSNGTLIGHVPDLDVNDVHKAIDSAYNAFHSDSWTSLTAKERSALLKVCN